MKNFILVFLTTATTLLLLYVNSFVFNDRTLFVPPPESVTEDFAKKIERKRFNVALNHLSKSSPLRRVEALKDLNQSIEKKLGSYQVYDGEAHIEDPSKAKSDVLLKGKGKEIRPVFSLINEDGLWKIDRLLD